MVQKAKSEAPIKLLRNVDNYQPWRAPAIDISGARVFRQEEKKETEIDAVEEKSEELITAEELQTIKDQAYTEAFEKGRSEGLESGIQEVEKKNHLLKNIIEEIETPLKECGENTQRELLELSFAIAKQILRRELKQEPTQLIAIIRESLQLLPIASKDIQILLHPDDASIIREALSLGESAKIESNETNTNQQSIDKSWSLLEDPSMQPGGCIIKTNNSKIDASIDQQIAVLFSKMMDEQRTAEDFRKNTKE
ncbi:MAG: hypothetical protein COB38_11655 [Gammaproteobacteria bacterium]|nr:MAG: hypothetical protein COB38_11655 [Gammaproteobacteria bacterium]